ncbi:MAG TPA: hemolysin family protein [Candidatus Nanoarchaeia archaeon]|nr:hemolysin family protein [Candidatus Nanoarchaeia archaeon]
MVHFEIISLIALIVLSAFFALSESALLSINKYKVKYLIEKKKFGAVYVKKLKDNPDILLSTILIGNNLANVGASAITTSIALQLFHSNAIGIATGIATFLVLIFGDLTPKSIGANNSEFVSTKVAPIIWHMGIGIYPLITLLGYFLKGINKLVGTKKIPLITEEELRTIIKTSGEEGAIKEVEKKMIQRVFDFDNTTVSDVMTGKKHMVSVGADMTIKDVFALPTAKLYSRFPVYDKHKDNIVGILYLKDTLKHLKDGKLDITIRQIMKKPLFVFDNKKVDRMLHVFQDRKIHMAIVINKKAQVVGLVTIENIIEEIVGEILDESDKIDPGLVQGAKNEWFVKGSIEIAELNIKTGIGIKEADFVDFDGFIYATLGRAPKEKEEIPYKDFKITMEDVQGKKVLRARLVKV